MADNLKALRRRVRSIKNTRKITRAMEMVSAAKLRRSQTIMRAGKPYAEKLQQLLGRLAGSLSGDFDDPLFQTGNIGKIVLVVFSGDRGLCGSFNTNVLNMAQRFIDERGRDKVDIVAIGRKAHDFFRKREYNVIDSRVGMGGKVDGEVTRAVAGELSGRFSKGEISRVFIAYNQFISQMTYKPVLEQFLPLEPDQLLGREKTANPQAAGTAVEYIFEPAQEQLLARLLPRYLESKLYITLAQTTTAEHSARMLAMNSATKNCGELIDSLTLKMNKARQAAITKEILEVVGGAEALKG